jgi:hypothetical protein
MQLACFSETLVRVYTASQPRIKTPSSSHTRAAPWEPQISHLQNLFHLLGKTDQVSHPYKTKDKNKFFLFCVGNRKTVIWTSFVLAKLFPSPVATESVICKTTWVHFLRELSCCYHGNHQSLIHRFPQESHQSKPLLAWTALCTVCFPAKRHEVWTHVVLYRFWFRFWP